MTRLSLAPTIILALTIMACVFSTADGQLPQSRLYAVFPPGAAPREIREVTLISGDDLDEVDGLLFNHPGIFATRKFTTQASKLDALDRSKSETNVFRVAVDPSVPPGRYEVRARGLFGVSNPRPFLIDARPTFQEAEPNDDAEHAQLIHLGTLINGQITGHGDIDYFRIPVKQGQRVVIDCLAERINSRLNPTLTLADVNDKPILFARNEYGFDAFLVFDAPADGEYLLKLHDETFRGGDDYVYRLQIHTGPHIRFVMPPSGVRGTTAKFTLYGYNLPGGERMVSHSALAPLERLDVDIAIPQIATPLTHTPSIAAGLDLFPYRHQSEKGLSNTVSLGIASAPVLLEQEPNNDPTVAQKLTVPFEIGGQFQSRRDIDVFEFTATKDQQLWVEVIGQRGGVSMDPYLRVELLKRDDKGVEQPKQLTVQDDTAANLAVNVFDTATDDPASLLKISEQGTYRVTLHDRAYENRGDPSLVYRLIVRPLQPDFRLIGIPGGAVSGQTWPTSLRRGDNFALDVFAFRRDGFDGPIDVKPVRLPFGLSTHGTVIRAKETKGTLVITASESADFELAEWHLMGTAAITRPDGIQTITRPVRSGGVIRSRSGNIPAISQLESSLTASVQDESAPFQVTHDFAPVTIHQGRQLLIPLKAVRRGFDDKLTLKFDGVPKTAKFETADVVIEKEQTEQMLRVFIRPDSPPGQYAIAVNTTASVPYRRNPQKADRLAATKAQAAEQSRIAKVASDEAAGKLKKAEASLAQATAAVQQAQQVLATAQTAVDTAQQTVTQAKQAITIAGQQVAKRTDGLAQAGKTVEEAEKAAANVEEAELTKQAEQAKQSAAEAQAALQKAQEAQTQAKQQFAESETAAKAVGETLVVAKQQVKVAEEAQGIADQKRAEIEARSQALAAVAKTREEARVVAEKAATDAANAAKPKNVNVTQPLPPLLITVKSAPIALTAKLSQGDVKQGETIDATVTIKRQNGFAGLVKLTLSMPSGVVGVTAAEVTVAEDKDSAILKIAVSTEAIEGDIAHLAIRATMDDDIEAIVDVPIQLKVTK